MKKKLIIIGASGHGKVVADTAIKMKKWEYIAFLDDDKNCRSVMGIDVIGTTVDMTEFLEEYEIFVGIGNNEIRKKIHENLEEIGASIPVLIHPSAIIGENVKICEGTVVMAGSIINCCTRIGKSCIINTGATVDHDNFIGNYVHVSPGTHVAGTVEVGHLTWLGIGSTISNNL